MSELFFGDYAQWFTGPALLGTAVFAVRLIMMLVGGFDGDIDTDFDADVGGDAMDGGDTEASFELLSVQTIAAFVMGFGWGGLAAYRNLELGPGGSIAVGAAIGFAMMWFLAWLFKVLFSLQASGNISIQNALGTHGVVYAQIPASGQGKGQVRVTVKNVNRIYNAFSEGDEIASQTRVRVVRVNDDNTLTVAADEA